MDKITELVDCLRKASKQYYTHGNSFLSDSEFDEKKEMLRVLDPENPFLSEVGSDLEDNSHWVKSKHIYPLGSLNKCQNATEFLKWANAYNEEFIVEEKLDGMSICLTYEEGKLISAVTRGSGTEGEDILRNVVKMKNVPLNIEYKKKLVIRAEIILCFSTFDKYLSSELKNPRNAAAGISKRLDGKNCEHLSVKAYDILNYTEIFEEVDARTERNVIIFLKTHKFDIVNTYFCETDNSVDVVYNTYIKELRLKQDWPIDGLVIKTNKIHDPKDNWEQPKNKIAWKFPAESARSTIKNIIWSVSNDRLTPVAIIDPVNIGGTCIQRASLHNLELAIEKNIGVGAEVEVVRRNDVIPYIQTVYKEGQKLIPPDTCPICKGKVEFEKNVSGKEMKFLICTNPECEKKAYSSVLLWLRTHDCKGVSIETIKNLFDNKVIDNLIDFLLIPDGEQDSLILSLDGFAKRKLEKMKEQIEQSKKTNLVNFFAALGFKGIGKKTFEKIVSASNSKTIKEFIDFCFSTSIYTVEDIGPTTVEVIKKEIHSKFNLILALSEIVTFNDSNAINNSIESKLSGKSFCFTGSLETMTREQAEDLVTKNGGKVLGVSKKLSYLVTNEPNSGSLKNKKAQELGIKIINELEFLDLIK